MRNRPPTTNRERKEVHPMDDITFNVFYATKTEADRYLKLSRTSDNQIAREIGRQRYLALYQLVVDSGLTDEYEAWEWNEEEEEE